MGARSGRNPKSPAFQFYPGDYLADPKVAAMTTEAEGAYMRLLCYAWIDGGIPNDPAMLAPMCKLTAEQFSRIWPMVSRCWTPSEDGTRLTNPRQERERAFQAVSRERRMAASKIANEQRKTAEKREATSKRGRKAARAEDAQRVPNGDRIGTESDPNRNRIGTESAPIDALPDTLHPIPDTRDPRPDTRGPALEEFPSLTLGRSKKRKPASGPHAEVIEGWCKLWLEIRGTPYQIEAKDGAAVSAILGFPGNTPALTLERARRLLLSGDTFLQQNASLPFLRSRWNQLAPRAAAVQIANEPKGFAGIREYVGTYTQADLDRFAAEEALATKSKDNRDQ